MDEKHKSAFALS